LNEADRKMFASFTHELGEINGTLTEFQKNTERQFTDVKEALANGSKEFKAINDDVVELDKSQALQETRIDALEAQELPRRTQWEIKGGVAGLGIAVIQMIVAAWKSLYGAA